MAFAANRLYLFAFFRNCLRRNIFGAVLSHFITFVRFLCLLRHIARGGIVCGLLRGSFGRMGVCNGLQPFGRGTQDSINRVPQVIGHFQRTKTGHRAWRIEIPGIFRKPDMVANRWIGRPAAAQRGPNEFDGHAGRQERPDVGFGCDRFD